MTDWSTSHFVLVAQVMREPLRPPYPIRSRSVARLWHRWLLAAGLAYVD